MVSALFLIAGMHSAKNLEAYKQKISLTQKIHMKNSLRKNVIRLLVCVLFSLGSICKYRIYFIDDIGVFTILSSI